MGGAWLAPANLNAEALRHKGSTHDMPDSRLP